MMKQTEQDSAMFPVLFRDDGEISIRPELPLRNEEMYIAVLEYSRILVIKRCGKDTSRPFARARIKKQNRRLRPISRNISERTNREIIQYKSDLSIIIFL